MLIILTSFNHVWTCLKDSAIKHNFCNTFSKQDWTCLLYDATYLTKLVWPGLNFCIIIFKQLWTCSKDIAIKTIIASLFQTVWNMKSNQNKLLHHFDQCCSKDDAIKTNYCITIFKQLWTCLKYDAIKTNYCITFINAYKTNCYQFK